MDGRKDERMDGRTNDIEFIRPPDVRPKIASFKVCTKGDFAYRIETTHLTV